VPAERLLRAHVERGADDEAGLGVARGPVQVLHDAEVHQQRASGAGLDQDVVGLDVAVHQAVLVGVLQSLQDRHGDAQRTLDRQDAVGAQDVGQGAALAVGHHVVHQPFALAHEVDREGVGMVEPGDRAGLLLEPGEGGRAPGDVRPQHLGRQPPLEILVPHLVHLGEAAPTQQPEHAVLTAEGPGQGRGAVRVGGPRGLRRKLAGRQQGEAARPAARAVGPPLGQRIVAGRTDQQRQSASEATVR
jgi:hypothetical protein